MHWKQQLTAERGLSSAVHWEAEARRVLISGVQQSAGADRS